MDNIELSYSASTQQIPMVDSYFTVADTPTQQLPEVLYTQPTLYNTNLNSARETEYSPPDPPDFFYPSKTMAPSLLFARKKLLERSLLLVSWAPPASGPVFARTCAMLTHQARLGSPHISIQFHYSCTSTRCYDCIYLSCFFRELPEVLHWTALNANWFIAHKVGSRYANSTEKSHIEGVLTLTVSLALIHVLTNHLQIVSELRYHLLYTPS